jgi:hypothetical protein
MLATQIINLPKFTDARGNLSFAEQENHIPFEIKRTYWVYDVPEGEACDYLSSKQNQEFIIALAGGFDVIVGDGENEQRFSLAEAYYGLYVPTDLECRIENFSTNSVALVLSSL